MTLFTTGHLLTKANREVIILEGRDRIGERVWTNHDFANIPIEFGAKLIHGRREEVNTWEWVHKLGLKTLHWQKTDDSMIRLEDGRWLTMQDARSVSPELEPTRSWKLRNVSQPNTDEDLETYLQRIGFNEEQFRYVKCSYANTLGDNIEYLNAKAYAELLSDDVEDNSEDYRI